MIWHSHPEASRIVKENWHKAEAVVVCPGDDLQEITRYVQRHRLDPDRVHFYVHPKASNQALAAWRDAGLPLDRVAKATTDGRPITDWESLHKLLGLHLNIQVVEDFLPRYEEP